MLVMREESTDSAKRRAKVACQDDHGGQARRVSGLRKKAGQSGLPVRPTLVRREESPDSAKNAGPQWPIRTTMVVIGMRGENYEVPSQ